MLLLLTCYVRGESETRERERERLYGDVYASIRPAAASRGLSRATECTRAGWMARLSLSLSAAGTGYIAIGDEVRRLGDAAFLSHSSDAGYAWDLTKNRLTCVVVFFFFPDGAVCIFLWG